ncbi:uncharacterized protein [Asterias amurensis]|uniref:uncharacterized protein n=1 Tax=Asterias amurensis TaxID=7602 RepID=UPI003AB12ED0
MKLKDFQKRSSAAIVNGDCVMTDLERHLCKMFKVIEIVGKRGRTVPVLLGTDVMAWLKALVANINAAGVAQDNIFLFARSCYGGSGHIRGSDCLRAYANQAGLENADSMRSTKLRKHVATVSQILALNEHQLETLADFMGHDLRVHREYYRLPDTVQRVTKLSRLFLSLERGNLVSQHGKSLEELHVTGEGFSSDDDSSDSGDSCDPALEDSVDDRRPPTQTDPAPKDRQVKRRQFKRRPWTAQEKKDVTEGLQRFFLLKKIPGKRDIESSCPVALQTRTWRNIKDFCRNTMTLQQI